MLPKISLETIFTGILLVSVCAYWIYWSRQNKKIKENCDATKQKKYRILIYGDSITWGWDGSKKINSGRMNYDDLYGNLLEKELGTEYEIISEGLSGRTINTEDDVNNLTPRHSYQINGMDQLLPIVYSHHPIDIFIVMLGINDTKTRYDNNEKTIEQNMRKLITTIKSEDNKVIWKDSNKRKIILITPPVGNPSDINKFWDFNDNSFTLMKQLINIYKQIAKDTNILNINSNDYIQTPKNGDGIHLDADTNRELAKALAPYVAKLATK